MRVFVYYNLHMHVWSIKALHGPQKGRVIGHSPTVLLADATGRVSQAGRNRVLRERRKNVHAGIVGTLVHMEREGYFPGLPVTYNPYKYESFVYFDTLEEYKGSQAAYLCDREVLVL